MFWARLFVENLTETETDKEDCKHTQQQIITKQQSTADVQLEHRKSAMKTHKELFLHHKSLKIVFTIKYLQR